MLAQITKVKTLIWSRKNIKRTESKFCPSSKLS